MSYSLRGRLESRFAALLPVVAAACALAAAEHRWWPVEAVALMLGVGLALDLQAYHRLLPYQPGWAAAPLGLLELGVLLVLMRVTGVAAPLVLEIPVIHVQAPVLAVGITTANVMAAPEGEAADPVWQEAFWYRGGSIPGEAGTALYCGIVTPSTVSLFPAPAPEPATP